MAVSAEMVSWRRTVAVTTVWFLVCNGWGLMLLLSDHVSSEVGLTFLMLTTGATVALGAYLAGRRMWLLSPVLIGIGAACAAGWFFLAALLFDFSLQSMIGSAFGGLLAGVFLAALFALGWPIGRLLRR